MSDMFVKLRQKPCAIVTARNTRRPQTAQQDEALYQTLEFCTREISTAQSTAGVHSHKCLQRTVEGLATSTDMTMATFLCSSLQAMSLHQVSAFPVVVYFVLQVAVAVAVASTYLAGSCRRTLKSFAIVHSKQAVAVPLFLTDGAPSVLGSSFSTNSLK